jgi:hypothetical protein
MLTTVAAAALALTLQPSADPNARPNNEDVPPLTVNVYAARGISPHLVTQTLNEAGAVWNDSGITLAWRVRIGEQPQYSATPHVVIDDDKGRAPGQGLVPVGWVQFNRPDDPDQEIHISRNNGLTLLKTAAGLGRPVNRMPSSEVELLLGRLLGRALAHEMGHYLLRSRAHTRSGLMRGERTIREFVSEGRRSFQVNPEQRALVATRIREMAGAET